MATINGSTSSSAWTYKLEVSESNVNINNNTSVVTVKAYIGRASSQSYLGGNWSGSITVNGSTQSMSGTISYPTYVNGGGWLELATKTFTVTHNNDGSKVVGVSSSFSSNDFTPSSASASGNVTLTTIPRSSTITATSVYIGETSQLTVTRYSNSFTHTIYYSFGSLNGYILADGTTTSTATKISATSIGFPIPSTWFAEIPNAKQGTCTLTITTYNGNTQISSAKTSTFIARVDQTTSSPIVTSSVEDINTDTLALTNNSNILIKGFSIPEVTWSATSQNSSTISNVAINGTTVTNSPYSFTLNDSAINVVANDSRGFSTISNPNFILKDYNAPLLTMSLKRVAPTSDYANISFSGTWFNDSFGEPSNFNIGDNLKYSNTYISLPNNLYTKLGTVDTNQTLLTTNNYKIIYEVENDSSTISYNVSLQDLQEPPSTNLVIYYAQQTLSNGNVTIYKNIDNLEVNMNFGIINYIDENNIVYPYFQNKDNNQSTTNNLVIKWKYKKTSDLNWVDGGTLVKDTDYKLKGNVFYSGTGNNAEEIEIGGTLDYNYAWDIMIYVEDTLSSFNTYQTITQGIPVINWGSDYFNVNGEIRQNNVPISGASGTMLWENSSPSSNFSAQTIQIDNLSKYKYIDIIFFAFTYSSTQITCRIYYTSNSNYNVADVFNGFKYNNRGYMGIRRVWVYANSIQFENNYIIKSVPSMSGADLQSDTSWTIPYRVIGYGYED